MSDRLLRAGVCALALAGGALSAYLLSIRWTGGELVCTTGGCDTVQNSRYAEILGAPITLLGLAGYALIGATALGSGVVARLAGAGLALAGVLFSAYLLVIQLVVIEAVCDWCLASDGVVTGLAVFALLRVLAGPRAAHSLTGLHSVSSSPWSSA